MAKKAATKDERRGDVTCKDCKHSTDWHDRGADGNMIFCRCQFQKWCKFLKYDYCENFRHR